MTQWDLSLNSTSVNSPTPSRRIARKTSNSRRIKTASRPLVESNYNAHLLHVGRSKNSIIKNGKKIKIRKVKK